MCVCVCVCVCVCEREREREGEGRERERPQPCSLLSLQLGGVLNYSFPAAPADLHISITRLPASARGTGGRHGNLIADRRFRLQK